MNATIEAPSGKTRTDENFPVGSFLIAPRLRPHIHAFYAFARNADDIADSPILPSAEKITRLNIMEDVLSGRRPDGSPTAAALRASLAETGVSAAHARDLLHAFRHDSLQSRTESWSALMEYCRHSAMPVGRYVLDLHGESRAAWPHSDALCASLQILNHLQDCATDFAELDRCYLPADLLAQVGASAEDLRAPGETPALRQVFNSLLDRCAELNRAAAALPREVRGRRLRLECAIIANLAHRLTRRLTRRDPLAARVSLTRTDAVRGILGAIKWIA